MSTTASNARSPGNSSVAGRKRVGSGSADIYCGPQRYRKNPGFVAELETQGCSDARRGLRAQARKVGRIALSGVGLDRSRCWALSIMGIARERMQNDRTSD